jgi:hypothetical protein
MAKRDKYSFARCEIKDLERERLFKNIRTIESSIGPEVVVDGKKVFKFLL